MNPDSSPVTVFCVDDQSSFRDTLRELVAATPGLIHVGEAASATDAIMAVAELRPALILMDVRMPGLNGFAAAEILAETRRDLVLVLMSAEPIDPPYGFSPRGAEVRLICKHELCPRTLLDLWHGRRTR